MQFEKFLDTQRPIWLPRYSFPVDINRISTIAGSLSTDFGPSCEAQIDTALRRGLGFRAERAEQELR